MITAAAFPLRAAGLYRHNGIPRNERVISDNAFAYDRSTTLVGAAGRRRAHIVAKFASDPVVDVPNGVHLEFRRGT